MYNIKHFMEDTIEIPIESPHKIKVPKDNLNSIETNITQDINLRSRRTKKHKQIEDLGFIQKEKKKIKLKILK